MRPTRFDLRPIVRRHYQSMHPSGMNRLGFGTFTALFLFPGALCSIVIALDYRVPATALTPALAGLGVLTGAFLTGFVLLMNTRIKARDDDRLSYRHNLTRLMGQTAVTSLYLVVFCMGMIAGCIALAVAWDALLVVPRGLSAASGLLLAGLVHVGLTGATFVRRLFGVYDQMFAADFAPNLQAVPTHRRSTNAG